MTIKRSICLFADAALAGSLVAMTSAAAPAETVPRSPIPESLRWISTGPLIKPVSDANHHLVSIKDPSIVRYGGKWHIYATVANTAGQWNMVYLSFADWSEAGTVRPVYLDTANSNLSGYHCAPQLFFFRPQKKWYLIYQSQPPTFSTTDDITKPETWSKPEFFFPSGPAGTPKSWFDFWVICDAKNAYLFSSGDDGRWYRCQTRLEDFPKGFSAPVVVMETPNRFDLFEASCVYQLKGTHQYLALIECIDRTGDRYFKSFLADRLDGAWTPFAATADHPFAGGANVAYEAGVKPWTRDISHGELLRDGYDETLTVDPEHLQLLYQGLDRGTPRDLDYGQLPYQLALLREDPSSE
jgi:hypothetical protein